MPGESKLIRQIVVKYRIMYLGATALALAIIALLGITNVVQNRRNGNNGVAITANLQAVSGKTHPTAQDLCETFSGSAGVIDADEVTNENRKASYKGISFSYHNSLASEIKAETKLAYSLEDETDKPDGVVPEHVSFTFVGPYASQHTSSSFFPEFSVYPITEYKRVLALSKNYAQLLERDIRTLKTMLATQQPSFGSEIPFLPFGIDASQAFHAQVKRVNFKNGRGIIFLTQFNIEPSLINNQGLVYTFQGLTNDGLYYVSARFPVTVPFLAPSYESNTFENYTLPIYFYGEDKELNEKNYKTYLANITDKLEKLPPNKFEPHLILFEQLINSLCIMAK